MKSYYRLTKPGIIYGNLLTAAAGFFLASKLHIYWIFIPTLSGIALVIASACVFNNYLDRGIDAKMARTRYRALVSGDIRAAAALVFAASLGVAGFLVLGFFTNAWVSASIGLAFVFYVLIYGWAKRHSVHGTLVGSVPGAIPPAAGYLAVRGHPDGGAWLVFLILVCWQMPHFYAIAIYRYKDYKAAGLPVLTVSYGMRAARIQTLIYIALFILANAGLVIFGYTGWIYLVAAMAIGLYWLLSGLVDYHKLSDEQWGRKMFIASLKVTLALSVIMAVGSRLP